QKAGNRFRITSQLVSTAAGHHLWSEKYDRDMEDIFAIQDEITDAIVGRLKPKLLGEEKARIPDHGSVDVEAYNLYLKGLWFLNKQREDGLRSAIEYFEKAVEIAP
ncbi:MAG: adenylate/guanylate cyclase domain-containing protein, partial [Desulfobacterales bacterium]|nr:adenylate/guanylate cyclase domain-containing protein [Desulfobacterales bacterium]NIW16542.1 adenylate/guanylate cyclase domain-containing protein [Candidatus Bathyarchaeota archaeon]